MLSMYDLPITEAVYTFTTNDGQAVHVAASTLRRMIEAHGGYPVTDCEMAPSLIEAMQRGDLGIEEPHAMRLPEEALEVPAIIAEWGDAHVCMDGAHRLWRRWQRGDKTFPAYVVPEALWRQFQISDMPGSADEWREWNRTAQIRTPELEAFLRLLGGS